MIEILLDVIILLLLVGFTVAGFKTGFAKTLVSWLGTFVSAVVAFFVSRFVALNVPTIFGGIVDEKVASIVETATSKFSENINTTLTSSQLLEIINSSDVGFLGNMLNSYIDKNNLSLAVNGNLSQSLANMITNDIVMPMLVLFMQILTFILAFIVCMIFIKVLLKALTILDHIPLVGSMNSLLGGVLGFTKGLIFTIIFALLVNLTLTFVADAVVNIDNTIILKRVYELLDMGTLKMFSK